MPTIEQMQNLPLSTDIATQEEFNIGISNLSTALIGTNEDSASADTINGSKKYAKEYANGVIDTIISGAPAAFDTLKEIADWISSDETSSAKLISDIIDLQKNVAAVSNDLSIDISRVTVTEDDGYEKGALLGTVTNHNLENPTYKIIAQDAFNDSMCFPINVLSDYGWELSDIAIILGNYIDENDNWLSAFEKIYGLSQTINYGSIPLSTITGYYQSAGGASVTAYWDSTYQASGRLLWCTTQNDPSTAQDGASRFNAISEKLINLDGTVIFRKPIVFWNYVEYDDPIINASFVSFLDYEAIPKKKVQRYDSVVSATYATKSELANALTDYVDLTSNQTITGAKTFNNPVNAYIVETWGEVRSKYSDDSFVKIDSNSGLTIVREGTETTIQNGLNYREFYLRDFRDGAPLSSNNYVGNTWAFPAVVPELSSKTLVFADRDFVLSALSSNSSSAISDIYVLSGEVVEGLSNTVIPKLSTIADLVSAEVERVDEISGKLSNVVTESDLAEYLPLSGGIVTGDVELSSASLTLSKHIGFESKTRMATLDFDGNAVTISSSPSSIVNINMALKNNETLFNNLSVVGTVVAGNGFSHTDDKFIANGKSNVVQGYVVAINGDISAISGGGGYNGIGTAINATISGNGNVAIGGNNFSDCSIIGNNSTLINSTIGNPALSGDNSIVIGNAALLGNSSIAFGGDYNYLIGNKSIGMIGNVSADYAIQLGPHLSAYSWNGNTEASSFNVFQYKMLDKDGLIPDSRLCSNIVRKSDITNFITQNDLSDCLKLTGGTMDGPIYSGENIGLGLRNYILPEDHTNVKLCVTYAVHGDEEYLLNNAEEGKTIFVTFESLFPYSDFDGTITPYDLSVLGGLQVGTYELSFVSDPSYDGYTDQGYVWEYRLSDENNNFGIFIGKENYPPEAEDYKYFSLDINSVLKVPNDEDLNLWFMESETFNLEHKKIPYGEVSPLVSQKYVDDKIVEQASAYASLSNVVDLTSNQEISGVKAFHDQIVVEDSNILLTSNQTDDSIFVYPEMITFSKNGNGVGEISANAISGITFDNLGDVFLLPEESQGVSQTRRLVAEDQLSAYVPLSDYRLLENRLSTLESRLSDIETIVDQINGTN